MTTTTIDDIQRDLPGYLQRVRAGETLLITQANLPIAELRIYLKTRECSADDKVTTNFLE